MGMETLFLGEYPRRLYTVVHMPSRPAQVGLVFCSALWDEETSSYKHLARWAKELEERGFAVVRFHAYGTGDSDGDLTDFTLEGVLADTSAAAQLLRERTGVKCVGIVGLRFGGSVAVHAASTVQADSLILWSPIMNLQQYCRELLRLRLSKDLVHQQYNQVKVTSRSMMHDLETGKSVDILGYELSPELYHQMNARSCWPDEPPAKKVLLLARPHEQGQYLLIVQAWKSRGCQVEVQLLPQKTFWEEAYLYPRLFADASLQWLARERLTAA
jgi:exosortase A-associated hydrolase 2